MRGGCVGGAWKIPGRCVEVREMRAVRGNAWRCAQTPRTSQAPPLNSSAWRCVAQCVEARGRSYPLRALPGTRDFHSLLKGSAEFSDDTPFWDSHKTRGTHSDRLTRTSHPPPPTSTHLPETVHAPPTHPCTSRAHSRTHPHTHPCTSRAAQCLARAHSPFTIRGGAGPPGRRAVGALHTGPNQRLPRTIATPLASYRTASHCLGRARSPNVLHNACSRLQGLAPRSQIPDPRSQIPDPGSRIPDPGSRIPNQQRESPD
jgi:hypothetical protein